MLERCGNCEACKLVEVTKWLLMPAPYAGIHADNATIDCWNKVLEDNPCENLEQSP